MKAIIFAAGLGTRIQEISKGKPKALVEFNGKTLLELAVEYLAKNGVEAVLINIHHRAEMMKDFINSTSFPIPITISDETDELLDTGGGLLKAKDFFKNEKDFVVFNVDVLTDLNLSEMQAVHNKSGAIATLAVRKRATSRYLLFDNSNRMVGWENIGTKEQILHKQVDYQQFAFSGIHILSTDIFCLLEEEKEIKFSITKSYIKFSKENTIQGYNHSNNYWFDVGKPESYNEALAYIQKKGTREI